MYSIIAIVKEHCKSLRSDLNPEWKIWIHTVIIPMIVGASLLPLGFEATSGFISVLVPMLSILVGFSINSVVMLVGQPEGDEYENDYKQGQLEELVLQTRSHTLYAIVFGLGLLAICGVFYLHFQSNDPGQLVTQVLSFILFTALAHYLLTLYLLPGRIYSIVEPE